MGESNLTQSCLFMQILITVLDQNEYTVFWMRRSDTLSEMVATEKSSACATCSCPAYQYDILRCEWTLSGISLTYAAA